MQNVIVESTIINVWIWLVQLWNGCLNQWLFICDMGLVHWDESDVYLCLTLEVSESEQVWPLTDHRRRRFEIFEANLQWLWSSLYPECQIPHAVILLAHWRHTSHLRKKTNNIEPLKLQYQCHACTQSASSNRKCSTVNAWMKASICCLTINPTFRAVNGVIIPQKPFFSLKIIIFQSFSTLTCVPHHKFVCLRL